MDYLTQIYEQVVQQRPLSQDQALWLLEQAELLELAELATLVRQRYHTGRYVTFHIDTNPNYTNICETACKFCAFYRTAKQADAYWLSVEQVLEKIQQAVEAGARTVLLQGGHNPQIPFDYYLTLITETKKRFPQVQPHFFSAAEICVFAKQFDLSITEILTAFYEAGQRTLPGGGAEILSERVRRKIAPLKATTEQWLQVHEIAHGIGFKTTATMMYGHVETSVEIVEHLLKLRDLQARTGGFYAFIPWSYKPAGNRLGKTVTQGVSEAMYLRIISLSRLVLDNFPHIQASWFSEGRKTGQLALEFGADDFGGTLLEEQVLRGSNDLAFMTVEEVLHCIHDAGYIPVQRDTLYQTLAIYETPNYFKNRILSPYSELIN